MLEKLIELAKTKTSLTLEVNTKNEIAQKLYLKYGFKNLGIRKKYYDGIEAVSYTHLDVYKRQVLYLFVKVSLIMVI